MGEPKGTQLLRQVATEARRLAGECAEGTAPELIAWDFGRNGKHCALGLILARAGDTGNPWLAYDAIYPLTRKYAAPEGRNSASAVLIDANNHSTPRKRHSAVVFPLLNFADACDRALKRIRAEEQRSESP